MTTWASRIHDLRATGMTYAAIGEAIGMATSSVSDIANGHTKEPGGDAALKLHELHRSKCKKSARASAA